MICDQENNKSFDEVVQELISDLSNENILNPENNNQSNKDENIIYSNDSPNNNTNESYIENTDDKSNKSIYSN